MATIAVKVNRRLLVNLATKVEASTVALVSHPEKASGVPSQLAGVAQTLRQLANERS